MEAKIYSMKTTPLFLLLAATLLSVSAQTPMSSPSDHPSLIIRKSVDPIMPQRLLELGIVDGEVRVVLSIDSSGKLSEWLVLGYTHPALADSVVAAIKRWEFDAPLWRGEPVSVQREVKFRFESRGAVISINAGTYMENFLAQRFPDRYVFHPCTLQDLDRIPTPLNASAPAHGKRPVEKGLEMVTVEFFIDQTGAVRMPSVVSADDRDLAAASVEAVRGWRFEPPTRQGQPVLVRAQQTFRFQP